MVSRCSLRLDVASSFTRRRTAPRLRFDLAPTGASWYLTAGARLSFQIHYTPSGKATTDQLRIGLYFAKEPPRYAVQTVAVSDRKLDIPRYDFNWQLRYDLKQPRFIPRGSTLKITAVFDNSPGNPANPDPTKTVHWGQQIFDEMMIGYVEVFTPLPAKSVAAK